MSWISTVRRIPSSCWQYASACPLHTSAADHFNPKGLCGFVFDIDGVLTRGRDVLQPAKEAFQKLVSFSGEWRYPVCFLTNGGGTTEAQKAEQLSNWLDVPATEQQVILSHSPMRALVPALKEQPVLISGRGDVLGVARHYGFQRVVSVEDLARAMPSAVPFARPRDELGSAECPVQKEGLATEANPIRAVCVITDPSNWYVDLQIILDVLMSGGVPTRLQNASGVSTSSVELYFSNPDLLWANDFPRNRLGQGAFAHVLLSMYKELTGGHPILVKTFGKPNPEVYQLAGQALLQQAVKLGAIDKHAASQPGSLAAAFSGIYCVGDNPSADIRGANRAGPPFASVLVKTGVWQGPGSNCPQDPALICAPDVRGAVEAAFHRTRSLRFHSMR